MGIFGVSVITFMGTLLVAWVLYHAVDRWILAGETPAQRDAEGALEEYYWFVVSRFCYFGFVVLLLMIFSVIFATEILYGTLGEALDYLLIVIPSTIVLSLGVFFVTRVGASRLF